MCDTCGCNITQANKHLIAPGGKLEKTQSDREAITVLRSLLHENDHTAQHNREHFNSHHVVAINLMSSPGAGKTALLEASIKALGDEFQIAVIEGDLETENDAERIRNLGVTAIQITTPPCINLTWIHLISFLLKTSATWCARQVLIWGNIPMWCSYPCPRAMTNRRNTRSCSAAPTWSCSARQICCRYWMILARIRLNTIYAIWPVQHH